MTNSGSSRGMWHRDWSAVAAARAVRWRSRTLPGLSTIARRAGPTLRLFGAGRKPGPSMATVLPRTLPLALRMKRPQQIVGSPMLTVQSEKSMQLSALREEDRTPVEPAAGADVAPTLQVHSSPAPPAGDFVARSEAREPESIPPSVAGRVSRAVQQILRRHPPPPKSEPPAAPNAHGAEPPTMSKAPAIAHSEPSAASSARGVEPPTVSSPREEPPAANASSRLPSEPSTAPSSEQAAPELESYGWQAGEPALPTSSAGPDPIADFESPEDVAEAGELQRPARPAPGGVGGMLLSLRRVFRHEPRESGDEAPVVADAVPAPRVPSGEGVAPPSAGVSQPVQGPAPTLARSTAPAEASSPAITEPLRRVETGRSEPAPPLTRLDAVSEAAAGEVQPAPAAEPRGESRGLLLTLRRLVRPERVSETTAGTAPSPAPAPAEAAPIVRQGLPAVQAESLSLAREIPVTPSATGMADFSDDVAAASEFEAEAFRPAPAEELTYLRPQSAARISEGEPSSTVEAAQAGPDQTMRSEAVAEDSGPDSAPARSSEGRSRIPRLLRLWRRAEEPRAGLNLTLARQAAQPSPAAQASPAAEPGEIMRSTVDAESHLSASAEVRRQGDTGFGPDSAATNRPDASPPVLRRPARASGSPALPRPAPSLVYLNARATLSAEAVLPGIAAGSDGAMRTLRAGPAAIARLRDPNAAAGESAAANGSPAAAAAGEAEVTPGSVGPAADVTAPPAEAVSKSQVNLETLARQVYDRLRQRLQVDRERAGIGSGMIGR